jgi:hypothetical protein
MLRASGTQAREVFYRGLKFAAVQEPRNDRRNLSEIFQHIEPLVSGLLKDLLNTELIHSDAVVRTMAKLILALPPFELTLPPTSQKYQWPTSMATAKQ